jgi:hypothetical protein
MSRLLLAVTAALLCALGPLSAQTLSQGERDRAMSELHATRKALIDLVSAASPAQLRFKPAPEVWSIAEIAEHIVLSESLIPKTATTALAAAADPEMVKQASGKDQAVLTQVPVRDQKFKAPESLIPRKTYPSSKALLAAFRLARDTNIAYLRDTKDPLRAHAIQHPALGPIDCYQVYLLLASHTQRHINQMLEVQGNPAFPKK